MFTPGLRTHPAVPFTDAMLTTTPLLLPGDETLNGAVPTSAPADASATKSGVAGVHDAPHDTPGRMTPPAHWKFAGHGANPVRIVADADVGVL
jgi:hypothetical protein